MSWRGSGGEERLRTPDLSGILRYLGARTAINTNRAHLVTPAWRGEGAGGEHAGHHPEHVVELLRGVHAQVGEDQTGGAASDEECPLRRVLCRPIDTLDQVGRYDHVPLAGDQEQSPREGGQPRPGVGRNPALWTSNDLGEIAVERHGVGLGGHDVSDECVPVEGDPESTARRLCHWDGYRKVGNWPMGMRGRRSVSVRFLPEDGLGPLPDAQISGLDRRILQ